MTTPVLSTEAAEAPNGPSHRFSARERKLLDSTKTYVDTAAAANAVTLAAMPVAASNTVASLAPAVMLEATGTLTQANLIAMYTTPVTLIADPAAGMGLIVDEIEFRHAYSTTVYTGGDDVSVEYSDGTDIVLLDKTLVTAGSSTARIVKPTIYNLDDVTGTGLGFAITAAKGVQITNATAVFAAGNVANVLKWRIRYHLVTLIT